jgi:Flp pilus assembly protein TadD
MPMGKWSDKQRSIVVCLALALGTLAVYWPAHRFGFIELDDPDYVSANGHIAKGVTTEALRWTFTIGYASNWHPLTWFSHALDVQLFGLNAGAHHLVNVLLHAANSLLLFLVLRRMTRAIWPSAVVAALFAWHPLHVESVAWIAERKDVLSTFFGLLTLWSYGRYVETASVLNLRFALLWFALGLMAKPMLVTLPFVLLLLDFWPLGRLTRTGQKGKENLPASKATRDQLPQSPKSRSWADLIPLLREKTPFLVLSAVSSVLTFVAQRRGGSVISLEAIPFWERLVNALVSYANYLLQMVWPAKLAVIYPYPSGWSLGVVTAALFALGGISVLVARLAASRPYLVVGWLWYLGTLVPVIGLVQVGQQAMADRYTYLPLTGVFMMVVWRAAEAASASRARSVAVAVCAGVVLCAGLAATSFQLKHWRNDVALFEHTLKVTTNNSHAHRGFGIALVKQGRLDEAIEHFATAACVSPGYVGAHYSLAETLARKGDFDGALREYEIVLRLQPDNADAHNDLGNHLMRLGRLDEAARHFTEALRLRPDQPEAHFNLALILEDGAKAREALEHLREALRRRPDWPLALDRMAWIRATAADAGVRSGAEAVSLAEQACALAGRTDPGSLDTLAAAYAEAGRFQEAVTTAQSAVELSARVGKTELAAAIRQRVALYQANRPYREPASAANH